MHFSSIVNVLSLNILKEIFTIINVVVVVVIVVTWQNEHFFRKKIFFRVF